MQIFSPPRALPLTLDEAKAHLRITHDSDDGEILDFVRTATEYVEGLAYRSLVCRTYQIDFDAFPDQRILLPKAPAVSIESFKYRDADEAWQTVSASLYSTNFTQQPGAIIRKISKSWPTTDGELRSVQLRYVAGMVAPLSFTGSTNTITVLGRTFADGDRVTIATSGTLPTAISANTTYFIRDAAGDSATFTAKLAATSGGSAIDFGDGSGQHWIGNDLTEWQRARQAIKLVLAHFYSQRGDAAVSPFNVATTQAGSGMPPAVQSLVRSLEIGDEFTTYPEQY